MAAMAAKVRRAVSGLAATPDAAVPRLPLLRRSLLLPVLSAASAAFRLSLLLRRRLFLSGLLPRRRLAVPVVSVGNLTWGGNGKTPMVEFLARRFHRLGVSPLLLTRGYAGGDESKMLQRLLSDTSAKIGIGANRAAVASSILDEYGYIDPRSALCKEQSPLHLEASCKNAKVGIVILDDGMQHWSLLRDVEIVMLNGLMPWGNTHLIPRGPMREPLSALNRADIVVIHHADLASEVQLKTIKRTIRDSGGTCPVFFSRLSPSHIFEVKHASLRLPLNVLNGTSVLCVSAIGFPDAFMQAVKQIGPFNVERLDFSDHHAFRAQDMELILETARKIVDQHNKETVVLVTEKDYDRDPDTLKMLDDVTVWVLSSSLQIMPLAGQGELEFMEKLKELIARTR